MDTLVNVLGITGVVIMAAGLTALLLRWQATLYWWVRPALILTGGAFAGLIVFLVRHEFNLLAYSYVFLIALLVLWQIIEGFFTFAQADWSELRAPEIDTTPAALRRARALERGGDYVAAAQQYDAYLEDFPDDAAARARLAEALVKSANSKRAIAVLTVAFSQAQESRQRILIGVRLAELILVVRRDPLAARAQLEQVRKLYAGTEHEAFAEDVAAKMLERVSEGRYLKKRPGRPA